MIVNMYVDHLISPPPASAEEVWNATKVHAKLFSDAAARIGLTPAEYKEFRGDLLDGKAVFVKLPRRVDAMSGDRHGSVYAVRNAQMTTSVMGWQVALDDGNVVYVPQLCGNISLLRNGAIAKRPTHKPIAYHHKSGYHYVAAAKVVPVDVVVPPETPPAVAPVTAQVIPAAATRGGAFPWFIPVAVGGAIAGLVHGSTTPVPPCTQGSNALNVCHK
jgi:hypothetical protein